MKIADALAIRRQRAGLPAWEPAAVVAAKTAGRIKINATGTAESVDCPSDIDPQPGDVVCVDRSRSGSIVSGIITAGVKATGPEPISPAPAGANRSTIPAMASHTWYRPIGGISSDQGTYHPEWAFNAGISYVRQGADGDTGNEWTGQFAYTGAAYPHLDGATITGLQIRLTRRTGGPAAPVVNLWASIDGYPILAADRYGMERPSTTSATAVTASLEVDTPTWVDLPTDWLEILRRYPDSGSIVAQGTDECVIKGIHEDPQAGLLAINWEP